MITELFVKNTISKTTLLQVVTFYNHISRDGAINVYVALNYMIKNNNVFKILMFFNLTS